MTQSHTWIYAIADTGYDSGVKVGRSSTAMGIWDAVPSYSPRPMRYLAAWRIPLGGPSAKTASAVERNVHDAVGAPFVRPRNGREWFDVTTTEAIARITAHLGCEPEIVDGHISRIVTNDQFRNPHPRRLGQHALKVVVWVYREDLSGRLKTQFVDDWTTPFEIRRRYSRNGFAELAAFSYQGAPSGDGNLHVLAAWTAVVTRFGQGPDDQHYGWLDPLANPADVFAKYIDFGLKQVALDRRSAPVGVRAAYNRPP